MNRHSLFSRSRSSGGTTGGRFKVGISPHSTTAPGNHSQTTPTPESVNKKYHRNADTEVARASEPCTCPQVLLKRIIFWSLMLTLCINVMSAEATFNYVGCTPTSGSTISSFDFSLEFNYDGLIEELGEGEYGIAWQAYYNAKRPLRTSAVELYEGDRDTGTFLARTMTSSITGKSTEFKIGNTVNFSFPDLIPEDGKKYTIYISNIFSINKKGESTRLGANSVNFYGASTDMDPSYNLVLTFTGKAGSTESLVLQTTSLKSQQDLDVFSAITYTFNNPISVNSDAKVQLKEGDGVVSTSTKWEQPDEKSVTFYFDNVELMLSHSYVLTLPEGVVSMASDGNQKNAAFDIILNGTVCKLIDLGAVTPATEEKQILSSVKASFNVPDGYKFYTPEGLTNKYIAGLYESEISDDNLLSSIQGIVSQGMTIVWDLPSSLSLMPDTEYILYVPEGQFWVYDSGNKRANEYSNVEVKLKYLTPTIEEANYPQIKFGTPVIGTHNKGSQFQDNMTLESLGYLDIAPIGEHTTICRSLKAQNEGAIKGSLYEVTDDGDILIKDFNAGVVSIDNTYSMYDVLRLTIDATLYEGKTYRIVVPAGLFTVPDPRLYNYVSSPELIYLVKGSTPTEIKSTDCSLSAEDIVSRLYNVRWTFKGNIDVKEDASAELALDFGSGVPAKYKVPLYRASLSDTQTNIQAICTLVGNADGNPIEMKDGWKGTITIPEGALYASADESITNKEIAISFIGKTPAPEVVEPEYVSLDVSFNGAHTTSTKVVKGEKVTLRIVPESWKIEKLVRYSGADDTTGDDMTEFAENGIYTSSGLNKDTRLEATLAYSSPLVFSDITTGVAELPDSDIQIFSEGDNIVVKGLSGGEFITVYTMAGIAVGSHETAPDKDTVNISAATGQTYIVRVQKADGYDYAAKIMHK